MGVNWAPYWHPTKPVHHLDRRRSSDPKARPNYDLWLLRTRRSTASRGRSASRCAITDHPAADVLPVFSPDGKQLMWTSNRTDDHSSQLWLADFKLAEVSR